MDHTHSARRRRGRRRLRSGAALVPAALVLAVLALAALALAGVVRSGPDALAASASPSASPDAGKVVLKVGTMEDFDNLNPFIGYSEAVFEVNSQNYEFLVERNPADWGTGTDGVAESWEVSADGKTWTFHLHDGLTWQDGQPLTAEDVAFTYNYITQNDICLLYTSPSPRD